MYIIEFVVKNSIKGEKEMKKKFLKSSMLFLCALFLSVIFGSAVLANEIGGSQPDGPGVSVSSIPFYVVITPSKQEVSVGEPVEFLCQYSFNPSSSPLDFSWSFGDGTNGPDQQRVTHIYNTPGVYQVEVSVRGFGMRGQYYYDTDTINIVVKGEDIKEIEPNNDYENVLVKITKDAALEGQLKSTDISSNDIFYFEVEQAGYVQISVKKYGDADINWVVHEEADLNGYAAYPTEVKDNELNGQFYAYPGKYYMNIYRISGDSVNYIVNLDGAVN